MLDIRVGEALGSNADLQDKGVRPLRAQGRYRRRHVAEGRREVERGLVDADLGGHVIKKRIARSGEGKSGGFRTIILFKAGERAFYVFGFSKSELGNIEDYELAAFKKLAAKLLAYSDEELSRAIETGALVEVT